MLIMLMLTMTMIDRSYERLFKELADLVADKNDKNLIRNYKISQNFFIRNLFLNQYILAIKLTSKTALNNAFS